MGAIAICTITFAYHIDNVYTLNNIEQAINNKIARNKTKTTFTIDQLVIEHAHWIWWKDHIRPAISCDPSTKSNINMFF